MITPQVAGRTFVSAAMTALMVGLAVPAGAQAQAAPFALPEGPGKETVAGLCGACHAIDRLGAGYSPEGWKTVIRMMRNFGAPIPPDQVDTITAYLTRSFPELDRPAAALIHGPVKGHFRMWPAATPGSRPHDPWVGRDGALWYTAQLNNALGRIDPQTGSSREYPMKAPQTAPHGLAGDAEGNIWFTGNFRGLMGKLDPRTGQITEYPLPDPAVRDPHTVTVDAQSGMVWFTAQVGNRIGRLDPRTGEIRLLAPSAPGSRPYGVQVDSKGAPFVVLFGTNKVARVDPRTLAVSEYTLPQGARPRRLAIDPQGQIWYTDFARGYLGRLDPVSGQVREWSSPSGARSAPYGIVFTQDAIWYSESNAKPNTLVRFDPRTERFQTWAVPGGGDIVRNMAVAPDGAPVMAHSLVNQLSRFEVER